ncbi:Retrovirus-related Pol polyprotein from transposon TNT 1-94 [Linum perenne]
MTGCLEKFVDLDRSIRGTVKFGDGSTVEICGRGSILIEYQTGEHKLMTDVYYIPRLKSNIISIGQLDENGCKIEVASGVMSIVDRQRKVLVRVSRSNNRLYVLKIKQVEPVCLAVHHKEESWLWHARYGHINFHALRKLAQENLVKNLPVVEQADRVCDGCMVGKQKRNSFPSESKFRATSLMQLVHVDLWRPIAPATHGGKEYFLLWVDDMTRYMWVALIKSKDEAFTTRKQHSSRGFYRD